MDMKVNKVLFVCLCFLLTTPFHGTTARKNVAQKNLEVKTHLRRLNKVPTKSTKVFLENVVVLERIIIQPGNDLFPHPAPGGYEIAWRKNVGILTKQVLDEELPGHIELVVHD